MNTNCSDCVFKSICEGGQCDNLQINDAEEFRIDIDQAGSKLCTDVGGERCKGCPVALDCLQEFGF